MIEVLKKLVLSDNIIVEDSIFENFPFEDGKGGAIYSSSIGFCMLKHLIFKSCSANYGGAIAIENSMVSLYTSCFASCNAKTYFDNGGNAFYTADCSFVNDLISSYKCAPDAITCGDAVFQVRRTVVLATHMNFSSCNGIHGECSFGSVDVEESHVCYMNVVDCYEDSMYLLPGSTLEFANFLRNDPYHYFINGNYGTININHSYFFANTENDDGYNEIMIKNIKYYNCFGDISRSGVNVLSNTITCPQTHIKLSNCIHYFDICTIGSK